MATLAPVLKQRFFNAAGAPLAGGKLYSYIAGTSTPQTTYTSQTGLTANANPVILDANGEANIWISDQTFKFVLKDSLDVTQWTVDDVVAINTDIETSADLINNLSIACSVAGSALTIALKTAAGTDPTVANPVKLGMRSATLIDGVITKLSVTAALSTVISSGSTAGHVSAIENFIYVGVLNNAGVGELCWSSKPFDESGIISTTAEGGLGGSDSAIPTTVYSNTARTGVAVRMVAKLVSTQTTAGTWAAVPTTNSVGSVGKLNAYMPPTVQSFLSGSGTYVLPLVPRKPLYIVVEMIGGGGGGSGSGTAAGSAATVGGNSTFGASLLTANGGARGPWQSIKAAGGGFTVAAPALDIGSRTGSTGGGYTYNGVANQFTIGTDGGSSQFGGAGRGGSSSEAGGAALANSGSGGGGGGNGSTVTSYGGQGGASGGYVVAKTDNPNTTYTYVVGAGGNGGGAGASGIAGAAGGSGVIVVTEYYQ